MGAVAAVAVVAVLVPSAAFAAEPGYAGWSGGSGAFRMASPAAGFPGAELSTNGSPVTTPSGTSVWMGEGTPFGAAYGSSRGQGYIGIGTTSGNLPSTTVLTFDTPTPASKWAFALGDIDVDMVEISGTDADGNALTGSDLGFQSAFNLCQNSPRPGGCKSAATDQPAWDEAARTLTGTNSGDTVGATGWFEPAVAVASLTFTFADFSGIPMFQLWVAAEAYEVVTAVEPVLVSAPGEPDPGSGPGDVLGRCSDMAGEVRLELLDAGGEPVADENGDPVTAELGEDGSFRFAKVFPGSYRVRIVTDEHYPVDGATVQDLEVADGDVAGPSFSVECVPEPAQAEPAANDGTDEDDARPALPVTGPGAGLWIAALLSLAGGALAVRTARNH
ncbi:hypothetical protein GCM10009830_24510 [Glycomyces endophyticus]|uniref:Carboxypeptidase regulatory-like domain-containing protein n=1 Tax=Glycomyces endophyticus TaxID=480996 RepID=A0ABP4ST62_9ACTN